MPNARTPLDPVDLSRVESVTAAAERCGLHRTSIARAIREGRIRARTIGGWTAVDSDSVDAYLAARKLVQNKPLDVA